MITGTVLVLVIIMCVAVLIKHLITEYYEKIAFENKMKTYNVIANFDTSKFYNMNKNNNENVKIDNNKNVKIDNNKNLKIEHTSSLSICNNTTLEQQYYPNNKYNDISIMLKEQGINDSDDEKYQENENVYYDISFGNSSPYQSYTPYTNNTQHSYYSNDTSSYSDMYNHNHSNEKHKHISTKQTHCFLCNCSIIGTDNIIPDTNCRRLYHKTCYKLWQKHGNDYLFTYYPNETRRTYYQMGRCPDCFITNNENSPSYRETFINFINRNNVV